MVKTGFITCIYSFFLSLLAFTFVSNSFFCAKHQTSKEVSLSKNINLFQNNASFFATPFTNNSFAPVKKEHLIDIPPLLKDTVALLPNATSYEAELQKRPSKKEKIISSLKNVSLPQYEENNQKNKITNFHNVLNESSVVQEHKKQNSNTVAKALSKVASFQPIPLQYSGVKPLFSGNTIAINSPLASKQLAMAHTDTPLNSFSAEKSSEKSEKAENTLANKENSIPKNWKKIDDLQNNIKDEKNKNPNTSLYNMQQVEIIGEIKDEEKKSDNTKITFNETQEEKDITQVLSDDSKLKKDIPTTKVAGEVVNNLLIPIPEDIINDKNLTPQLVSDPNDKKLEQELIQEENKITVTSQNSNDVTSQETGNKKENSKEKSGGLLQSLTSIFSNKSENNVTDNQKNKEDNFNDDPLQYEKDGKILPSEMRLSFQPNRAEISGKTLKWIQAFGEKAKNNDGIIIEIRIDGTTYYALQQKRLNLLYNILTNLGLDYNKISTVFTARDTNSFIIRTVRPAENKEKRRDPVAMYYQ